jgi:urea carboxylase-associated protein 2
MSTLTPDVLLWEELLPGGNHWSGRLRRGSALRLTDCQGGANLSGLFFNAEQPLERYNMPDTLKSQHTAFLTAGHVCQSDMGRVLCSITADSLGWHDTWCGVSDADMVRARYGATNYQHQRNAMHRNGRDNLLIELAKWGLGPRDLVPCVNFFSKVVPDADGALRHVGGHSVAGSYVDLRFEMDTWSCSAAPPTRSIRGPTTQAPTCSSALTAPRQWRLTTPAAPAARKTAAPSSTPNVIAEWQHEPLARKHPRPGTGGAGPDLPGRRPVDGHRARWTDLSHPRPRRQPGG